VSAGGRGGWPRVEQLMTESTTRTFASDFRQFFLRGLVVLLPSVLTLWIVVKAYQFVDNTIAEPVNRGVRLALINIAPHWETLGRQFEPSELEIGNETARRLAETGRPPEAAVVLAEVRAQNIRQWWQDRWYMDLIGLLVAIIAVYVAGRLLGGFVGRRLYRKVEGVITSLPIFKQVYPYVKQIVDFLFSDERPIKFNRVVVTEYPRKGVWSVGFQTGGTMRSIARRAGDSVTIFIPSSPTPFTGYTITVPRSEVIELPITVEEAIRFAVSGGVLVPQHQLPGFRAPGEPELQAGPEVPGGPEGPDPAEPAPEPAARPRPRGDLTPPEGG
jgi:uncharacterized membrane protein